MAQDPIEEGDTKPPAKTPTGQQASREASRRPTQQVPEYDDSRIKTAPVQKVPGDKVPTRPTRATRSTQMLSLEPPKRRVGAPGQEIRLDSFGGPRTLAQRNQTLMGKIGREKTGKIVRPPPSQEQLSMGMGKPSFKREPGKGMDLSGSQQSPETMMRRKATRLIPKPGGGFQGDDAVLASMESGQLAPVMQPKRPTARQPVEPPPRVSAPIPQSPGVAFRRPDLPPPPPSARGNTLTGISAEDLLGDEGRRVLHEMRRREAEARARGEYDEQFSYGGKAQPAYNDSSRQEFQGTEYNQKPSEGLEPQDFMAGPTRAISREEMQRRQDQRATAPVDGQAPPPDDLGYEKPVNFGDAQQPAPAQDPAADEDPVARESVAHDELEQRAGYLMWLQGVITLEEVEESLKASGDKVSAEVRSLLMNTGFTEQITLYRFLARHESLALVDFDLVEPSREALAALRPAIARAYRVVPFAKLGELLFVAAGFPFDPRRLLELRRLTASKVKLYVATDEDLAAALAKYYGETSTGKHTGEGETLQKKYDPTLTGEDSGLYAPTPSSLPSAADVRLAELDYAGGGVGSDSSRADRTSPGESGRTEGTIDASDTLDNAAIAAAQRTAEGKTDSMNAADVQDELQLNAPPSGKPEQNQGGPKPDEKKPAGAGGIDSGPEDHDPFLE